MLFNTVQDIDNWFLFYEILCILRRQPLLSGCLLIFFACSNITIGSNQPRKCRKVNHMNYMYVMLYLGYILVLMIHIYMIGIENGSIRLELELNYSLDLGLGELFEWNSSTSCIQALL